MDRPAERSISRRTLFRGVRSALVSAGTMALLPRVDGGYLMPVAYAQESAGTLGDASYTFHVVAPDEVGIHVVDVSNVTASGDFAPVKGATVTITSHFNQAQVSGDTDGEGKVYLSLRDLTVTDPDDPTLPLDGTFQCNARIEVDASRSRTKMRNFATELEALVGQSGYVIGTHALLATDATYIKSLLFDRWDIQGAEHTWYRSIENDLEHTFTVVIEGLTADVEVSLGIYKRDDAGNPGSLVIPQMKETATYDAERKLATATFSGHFLELGHKRRVPGQHGCRDGKGGGDGPGRLLQHAYA